MEKIKALGRDVAKAVYRYYGSLLVAFVATGAFVARAEIYKSGYTPETQQTSEALLKLAFVGLLGISLLFSLHMAQQRYRIKWPLPIVGFFVLAAYYALLPSFESSRFQPVTAIILGVSAICFHILASTIPFLKRGDTIGFWDYNKSLFINTVQTIVFTTVLWGGLALAVVAVENLFNLHVSNRFWEQLATTIFILGSSLIFTLFAKGGLVGLTSPAPYPPILRFFVQYILIPLLVIYLLILYSYAAKIVLEWNLPKGWVSYLVLAYSALGVLSLLLLHPLNGETEKIWVRFFTRSFYMTLLPMLVLLFVAIGVRVADYGVTENRYYVLLLAVWLLGIAGYQLLRRQNEVKAIPVSLLAAGICSMLLPFGNVFTVSLNSQSNRLHRLLSQQAVLTPAGQIDFGQEVKRSAVNEISNLFYYLHSRNQHRIVRELISSQQVAKVDSMLSERWTAEYDFANLFTSVIEDDAASKRVAYVKLRGEQPGYNRVYETRGYEYLIPMVHMGTDYPIAKYTLGKDSLVLEIGGDYPDQVTQRQRDSISNTISLYLSSGDTVFRHNYTAFIDSVYEHHADKLFTIGEIKTGELATSFKLGAYQVEMRFNEIGFQRDNDSQAAPVLLDSLISITKVATFLIKH